MAGVADGRTLAAAIWTGLLDRKETLLHAHLAMTSAGVAGLRRRPRTSAATRAFGAVLERRYADLYGGAVDGVLEAEFEVVLQISTLAYAGPSTAAENIAEYVAEGISETAAAETTAGSRMVDAGMTELVIGGTFVRIGEYLESFLGFLELGFGLIVIRIAIRMIFHCQAPERLFDIGLRCAVGHLQNFVVIAF